MTVQYKIVPGFPKHRVGNDGSVWSRHSGKWRQLKAAKTSNGYRCVILSGEADKRWVHVHTLVLECFVGLPPDGHQCLHADADKSNNCLKNLSWGTAAENGHDRTKHGSCRGENNGRARLTANDVVAIRQKLKAGSTRKQLAEEYGVHYITIRDIEQRRSWRHL